MSTGQVNEKTPLGSSLALTIKALREIGDMMAKSVANDQGELLTVVRSSDLYMKEAWEWLKKDGKIPKRTAVREFRIGWRGDVGIKHGTVSGYNKGCRQECCKRAVRAYQKVRYQDKKIEARLAVFETHQQLKQKMEGLDAPLPPKV